MSEESIVVSKYSQETLKMGRVTNPNALEENGYVSPIPALAYKSTSSKLAKLVSVLFPLTQVNVRGARISVFALCHAGTRSGCVKEVLS